MEVPSHLKLFLLSCILLLSSSQIQATSFHYCDNKEDYAVKVKGVEVSPNPVDRGKLASFNITATTDEPISGGKFIIEILYFGVHVHREAHDVCEEAFCPVTEGDFALGHAQTLPSFAPPGSYVLKMSVEDEENAQLTCITFNFKIGFGSPGSDV